jgi:hypothetical protein
MTPSQKRHAEKAEELQRQAARALDKTKTGHSPKAAELTREANVERVKAGLATGVIE